MCRTLGACLLVQITLSLYAQTPHPTSGAATKEEIVSLWTKAAAAQQHGDYQAASKFYERVVNLAPQLIEARVNLGLMYHLAENYQAAVASFGSVIRLKPDLFVAQLFLGLDLIRLHRFAEAAPHIEQAGSLFSGNDFQAAVQLARAYVCLEQMDKAAVWYERAARMNSQDADLWRQLGICYLTLYRSTAQHLANVAPDSARTRCLAGDGFLMRGKLQESIHAYQDALAAPDSFPGIHAVLGFAYLKADDTAMADKEFRNELGRNPGSLLARLGAVRISISENKLDAASVQLLEIWNSDPRFFKANCYRLWSDDGLTERPEILAQVRSIATSVDAHMLEALMEAHDETQGGPRTQLVSNASNAGAPVSGSVSALQMYDLGRYSACEMKLNNDWAKLPREGKLLLTECAFLTGAFDRVHAVSQAFLTTIPNDPVALFWNAKALQALALQALRRAGAEASNTQTAPLLVAESLINAADYAGAEIAFSEILRREPDNPDAHLGLATAYYGQGKYDRVEPELDRVFARQPDDPDASYLRAEILINAGQYSAAARYVENALSSPRFDRPRVYALNSKILASEGKLPEAIACMKMAAEHDDTGVYYYQLAGLMKRNGDEADAAQAFKKYKVLHDATIKPAEALSSSRPN